MIEKYTDITADDNHRYNACVKAISDGLSLSAEDAQFYGEFCAAVASYEIELNARLKAIEDECAAKIAECVKTEKAARTGYNKLVNAALERYERARGENDG